MSFHYIITLLLIYYAGVDICLGDEITQTLATSFQDPLYHPHAMVVADMLAVTELDFELSKIRLAIQQVRQQHLQNQSAGKLVILTRSKFAHTFLAAMQLLAPDLTPNWTIFYDLTTAISSMGLAYVASQILDVQANLIPLERIPAFPNRAQRGGTIGGQPEILLRESNYLCGIVRSAGRDTNPRCDAGPVTAFFVGYN